MADQTARAWPAPGARIYIAGPMRGWPDHNFPAFHAAEDLFEAMGWEVVSPVTIGHHQFGNDPTVPGGEYLRADLRELVDCNAIALLPEWDHSTGARCEAVVAVTIGLAFFDATTGKPIPAPSRIVCAGGYDRPAGPVHCTCEPLEDAA